MLTELTPAPLPAVPLAEFARHLRLPSGFEDEGAEAGLLDTYLRAAAAAIEAMTGKALIARDFSYRVAAWRASGPQTLPVGPVSAISAIVLTDRDGVETTVDPSAYVLRHKGAMGLVSGPGGASLPMIPTDGVATIRFTAGYGADWTDIPVVLRQAVMTLAAEYYEARTVRPAETVAGVETLIAPYRERRL